MTLGPTAIIGLGLIGGSLARALLAQGATVRGWTASPVDRRDAMAAGIPVPRDALSRSGSALAAEGAAVVVLAVPIDQIAVAVSDVWSMLDPAAVLLHVGSLQRQDALALSDSAFARLIGAHPLAGSHEAGFAASRAELFRGATVSVESRAPQPVRAVVQRLWESAGATQVHYRTAEEHDRLMVWASHLPQLMATALASALARADIEPSILGPGARDTTRLAASPFELWRGLLRAAPNEVGAALEALEESMREIRDALERRDEAALAALWEPARAWRCSLRGGG